MTTAGWFSQVGHELDADGKARIAGLLSARSCGSNESNERPDNVEIEAVSGPALSRVLLAEEHDNLWWDAEESERERLWEIAAERVTETFMVERLSASDRERVEIREAAALVGKDGAIDASHVPTAIEAAMLSLHQNALAEFADTPPEHWFRVKRALFGTGRWPLGFRDGRLLIA